MENITLLFSGGIHDLYYGDLAKYLTNKSPLVSTHSRQALPILQANYKNVEAIHPNTEELFFLIKHAIKLKYPIGIHSTLVSFFT